MSQQKAELISKDFYTSKQIPVHQRLNSLIVELDGYMVLVQVYNWTGSSSSRCKKLSPPYTWPKPNSLHLFHYAEHRVLLFFKITPHPTFLMQLLASNFTFSTQNESLLYVYCGSNINSFYYVLYIQNFFLFVLLKWVSFLLKTHILGSCEKFCCSY